MNREVEGCDTKMIENKAPRKIFGPNRDEASGKWSDGICQLTIDEQFEVLLQDGARVSVPNTTLAGKLPPWFDQKKFKRGQQFFHQNYYALFVSKLSGLLTILVIPSILRVLVLTKQSGEPLTAFKRYLSTLSHMLDWYEGELLHSDSRTQYIERMVVQTLDQEQAVAITEANAAISFSSVSADLEYVKSNFGNLPGAITILEARDSPLMKAAKIMWGVKKPESGFWLSWHSHRRQIYQSIAAKAWVETDGKYCRHLGRTNYITLLHPL
uniref:Uncharacterized protein n=1 Tax=Timema shepardi TaxID=629360 RepID=A0A7R9B797_TIMSH|nr:unnamed protein product [Timema shepardi]